MNRAEKRTTARSCLAALAAVAAFALLAVFPQESLSAAGQAVESWLGVVVPSMLPFFIAANILAETGAVRLLVSSCEPAARRVFRLPGGFFYAFAGGALSGYPMGARLAARLYADGELTESDAARIINGTSVSGPLFIIGAVCVGMLGAKELAVYLLVPHYAGALLTALLGGLRKKPSAPTRRKSGGLYDFLYDNPLSRLSFGQALSRSVGEAINGILAIGGFMVLFSVLNALLAACGLSRAPSALIDAALAALGRAPAGDAVIAGFFELTTGCLSAASSGLPLRELLPLLAALISFSGVCIHAQTRSVAAEAGIRLHGFFAAKLLHAAIAYALCAAMLALFEPDVPAFRSFATGAFTSAYMLLGSIAALLATAFAYLLRRLMAGRA